MAPENSIIRYAATEIISGLLGILVFAIGLGNLFLVHPVPGIVFLILSLLYFPATNTVLKNRLGFTIPVTARIILGLIIIWFTLGVSDLGEIID